MRKPPEVSQQRGKFCNVVVSGEKINGDAVKIFERHGIKYVDVLL